MAERPLIFSGAMIRAVLENRKTQTRRVVKTCEQVIHGKHLDPSCDGDKPTAEDRKMWHVQKAGEDYFVPLPCPYGVPGDHLWVRETWATLADPPVEGSDVVYRADLTDEQQIDDRAVHRALRSRGLPTATPWRPSIHMPRWASRITLELTSVRVERVQDISESDAIAEGVEPECGISAAHVAGFAALWDSLNARRGFSWESNCWVWVLTFRRLM